MCHSRTTRQEHKEIRDAFGSFPTGVAIVTAQHRDGRPFGLTINSLSTISLSPRLISWCIDLRSSLYADFAHCKDFTVHILSDQQQDLARHFAQPAHLRHDDHQLHALLPNSVCAWFACLNYQQILLGDHLMMIGQVTHYHKAEHSPLLFAKGKFQTLPNLDDRQAA